MIVALFWAIQPFSSASIRSERSPIVKKRRTGRPVPIVPITTKSARATACEPAAAPVPAIAEAAPTTRIRFFGLTAASARPRAASGPR